MRPERIHYAKFSEAEYAARYQRIREAMGAAGLDCLIVYGAYGFPGTDNGQPNMRYISNFPDHFHSYCVFPLRGEPTLLTSFVGHADNAREISVIRDLRIGYTQIAERTAEVVQEKGHAEGRIGIVGVNSARKVSIPWDHYQIFEERLPRARFEIVTEMIERLRQVKSAEEIAYLERGARITEAGFEAVLKAARPGATNHDLFTEYLAASHRAGGALVICLLGSTSMANPDLAFPDPYPSNRALARGDIVISEVSSAYNGYSGQLIRPVALGEPPKAYRDLFDLALHVYRRMAAALRPGCTEQELLEAAQPIVDAGLTTKAPLFHGWGNMIEMPLIGLPGQHHPVAPFVLKENMTVVVEPNPCTPDGKKGIFLGDLWHVTRDGARSLHTLPPEKFIVL